MNTQKLSRLPWYVKPFIRVLGLLLGLLVGTIGSMLLVFLYLPFVILLGGDGPDILMEAWEVCGDVASELFSI